MCFYPPLEDWSLASRYSSSSFYTVTYTPTLASTHAKLLELPSRSEYTQDWTQKWTHPTIPYGGVKTSSTSETLSKEKFLHKSAFSWPFYLLLVNFRAAQEVFLYILWKYSFQSSIMIWHLSWNLKFNTLSLTNSIYHLLIIWNVLIIEPNTLTFHLFLLLSLIGSLWSWLIILNFRWEPWGLERFNVQLLSVLFCFNLYATLTTISGVCILVTGKNIEK